MQERLASEVAALEKRKHGTAKSGKGAKVVVHSSITQTDADSSLSELQTMAQQLTAYDSELVVVRAELQRQTHAIESSQAANSDLSAAHEALLSQTQASEHTQSQQLKQSQQELAASQLQCKQLLQQLDDSMQQLAKRSEQLSDVSQRLTAAETALAAQVFLYSELQSMTEQLKTVQAQISQLESTRASTAQQLDESQSRNSRLEQTLAQTISTIKTHVAQVFSPNTGMPPSAADANPVLALDMLVGMVHIRAREAEAAVEELTQQLQSAVAAHAAEAVHMRYGTTCTGLWSTDCADHASWFTPTV